MQVNEVQVEIAGSFLINCSVVNAIAGEFIEECQREGCVKSSWQ